MSSRQIKRSMKNTRERVKFELQELLNIPKNKIDSAWHFGLYYGFLGEQGFQIWRPIVNLTFLSPQNFHLKVTRMTRKFYLPAIATKGIWMLRLSLTLLFFCQTGMFLLRWKFKRVIHTILGILPFSQSKYSDSLLLQILDIKKGSV